ncbi:hypothetical protein [Pseudonocardia sp.]|uniref:hypothetical protein n=1 Tax=Pseudonocardia sp. TaxID=60912 RepID=UPI003D0E4C99
MPTGHRIRERLSDALLSTATELTLERVALTRRLEANPAHPGYHHALAAMTAARWVDSTLLWLSWRLRPRLDVTAGGI